MPKVGKLIKMILIQGLSGILYDNDLIYSERNRIFRLSTPIGYISVWEDRT